MDRPNQTPNSTEEVDHSRVTSEPKAGGLEILSSDKGDAFVTAQRRAVLELLDREEGEF